MDFFLKHGFVSFHDDRNDRNHQFYRPNLHYSSNFIVVYLVIIFPILAYCVMNMKSMSPTLVLLFLTQSIKSVSTELREIGSET